MKNIGFTTSPDTTTIIPEKLGEIITQMAYEFPTIYSWLSNGLFVYIVRTH